MAGLDPAIHATAAKSSGVDARDKRGHDALMRLRTSLIAHLR